MPFAPLWTIASGDGSRLVAAGTARPASAPDRARRAPWGPLRRRGPAEPSDGAQSAHPRQRNRPLFGCPCPRPKPSEADLVESGPQPTSGRMPRTRGSRLPRSSKNLHRRREPRRAHSTRTPLHGAAGATVSGGPASGSRPLAEWRAPARHAPILSSNPAQRAARGAGQKSVRHTRRAIRAAAISDG